MRETIQFQRTKSLEQFRLLLLLSRNGLMEEGIGNAVEFLAIFRSASRPK
jgi:hypothetical protein